MLYAAQWCRTLASVESRPLAAQPPSPKAVRKAARLQVAVEPALRLHSTDFARPYPAVRTRAASYGELSPQTLNAQCLMCSVSLCCVPRSTQRILEVIVYSSNVKTKSAHLVQSKNKKQRQGYYGHVGIQ